MNSVWRVVAIVGIVVLGPGWLQGEKAESREPACEDTVANLSRIGRVDEALSAVRTCLKEHPGSSRLFVSFGYLLLERGATDEALEAFEQALALRPGSSAAKTGKGIVLSRNGKLKEAEALLHDALKLNPDPARTFYELGLIAEELGNKAGAMNYFKQGIEEYSKTAR